jgi:hypothetical protein
MKHVENVVHFVEEIVPYLPLVPLKNPIHSSFLGTSSTNRIQSPVIFVLAFRPDGVGPI